GLVVAIIFFTTSILFNSLRLPLVIISVIPVSYVGLFLTFFLFGLNFDQGGFAALILLCGITVNASIYIVDEYRQYLRRYKNPRKSFVKAFSIKIIPIMLTILSTILGFIPFMVGDGKEAFWFTLAAGTIGGLVMSLVGIVMFLPGFLVKGK
ncbi:MAG: efflux RND transporter permease subunit, partial [Bacteroidales bacterium]|nr:efflux RND transporter permease subunit [Bacteroidales bacterium]